MATIQGGTHFSSSEEGYLEGFPDFLKPPSTATGRRYLQLLSVAFFRQYLQQDPTAASYLTPEYLNGIADRDMPLHLVRSLTSDNLTAAYGDAPPIAVLPAAAGPTVPTAQLSVLDRIRESGTLVVGIREDAAPFGYLDSNGNWTGYCFDLVDTFGDRLSAALELDGGLEVVRLPSNLNNRFQLLGDGTVHLECGPNTIRQDVTGAAFSFPFFYTGTQMLTLSANASQLDLPGAAPSVESGNAETGGEVGDSESGGTEAGKAAIGVLSNTTNAKFMEEQYPNSNLVFFEGVSGRDDAVQALAAGDIQAFASDGVLLLGELAKLELAREDYALVPENPLTCDGYGLLLPEGDRQWQTMVNQFLRSQDNLTLQRVWLTDGLPSAVATLDYCLSVPEEF